MCVCFDRTLYDESIGAGGSLNDLNAISPIQFSGSPSYNLAMTAASTTESGYITTSAQNLAGVKGFDDGISATTTNGPLDLNASMIENHLGTGVGYRLITNSTWYYIGKLAPSVVGTEEPTITLEFHVNDGISKHNSIQKLFVFLGSLTRTTWQSFASGSITGKMLIRSIGSDWHVFIQTPSSSNSFIDVRASLISGGSWTWDLNSKGNGADPSGPGVSGDDVWDNFTNDPSGYTKLGYIQTYPEGSNNRSIRAYGEVEILDTTDSTSISTGSLTSLGGIGTSGNIHVGGSVDVGTTFDIQATNAISEISNDSTLASASSTAIVTEAALKSYIDNVALGQCPKQECNLGTAAALPANTYSGTPNFTLTATANGALSVDGSVVTATQRILVKDEVTTTNNGIYVVTTVGDGSNPYVLTRATDYDTSAKISSGDVTYVATGSTNAEIHFVMTNESFATLDTDAITWAILNSASHITGPGVSVVDDVPSFSTTNGKTLQDSGVKVQSVGSNFKIQRTSVILDVTASCTLDQNLDTTSSPSFQISSSVIAPTLAAHNVNKTYVDGTFVEQPTSTPVNNDGIAIYDGTTGAQVKDSGITTASGGNAFSLSSGTTDLICTTDVTLDQDVATTATPSWGNSISTSAPSIGTHNTNKTYVDGAVLSAIVTFGNSGVLNTTATRYLEPYFSDGTAPTTRYVMIMPRAGTLKNMYVVHSVPAGNGSNIRYRLEKNSTPDALDITIASTAASGSDLVNTVSIAAGDTISLEVTKAVSIGTSPAGITVSMEFVG
jgi:hypothetical protein